MRLSILLTTVVLASSALHAASVDASVPVKKSWHLNSLMLSALDKATAGGVRISIDEDRHRLAFHLDTRKLPHSMDKAREDTRVFTADAFPDATARQAAHYGLFLPPHLDASRPVTILIHGLDSDCSDFTSIGQLLRDGGQQTACFVYPNDERIDQSAAFFVEHLAALHETFPDLAINVVAHSMGSLVARAAIEGPEYPGGVHHFILIAPPNHGTALARYRFLLELREHYWLWKHDKGWSPTWMITDGLGEAGRDLKPNSRFLARLNSLPRRSSVEYTIIAGTRNPYPWLWRDPKVISDGPVPLSSTRLEGVGDYIQLPADHNALLFSFDHSPPVSWPIIRDRLMN